MNKANLSTSGNQHPAVMFEIMANDQAQLLQFYQSVFGWQAAPSGGFDYIKFPVVPRALLGGIGQAQPGVVGWNKGITFYLQVADIDSALAKICERNGSIAMPKTSVDGYTFAMFNDPEGNLVGLIQPFDGQARRSSQNPSAAT